jgi:hypothetical protein
MCVCVCVSVWVCVQQYHDAGFRTSVFFLQNRKGAEKVCFFVYFFWSIVLGVLFVFFDCKDAYACVWVRGCVGACVCALVCVSVLVCECLCVCECVCVRDILYGLRRVSKKVSIYMTFTHPPHMHSHTYTYKCAHVVARDRGTCQAAARCFLAVVMMMRRRRREREEERVERVEEEEEEE